jgi:histidinol dehydrogenase
MIRPCTIITDCLTGTEHDEDAQSILLCPDANFIAQVEASIAKLLPTMTRKTIIAKALKERERVLANLRHQPR